MLIRFKPDPYGCYALAFGTAVMVYLLGWSELYPPLRAGLLLFLLGTCIVYIVISRTWLTRKEIAFVPAEPGDRAAIAITLAVYAGWIAEFVYEGGAGVPLFKILLDQPYDYKQFGIPSFHVLMVTFASYYTLYLFHAYLSGRKRLILLLYAVHLMAAVLIYSRAMLFFNITGSLFIFLFHRNGLSLGQLAGIAAASVVLFYLFGVLGSLRVSRIAKQPYNNENFMATGQATEAFRNSFIPNEYFWAYIYISSPLANLQQNIDVDPPEALTGARLAEMVNSEIFPDFISKRVIASLHLNTYTDSRIPGPFNVSTIYSRSYSIAGWTGAVLMALFLAAVPIVFVWLLPPTSRFFVSGWCLLCTMYFFSVYDNTFRFTGLSFQLCYPILLHWIDGKSRRLSRVF